MKDKSKIGNWQDGDCFAIEIKNSEYEKYNQQFIIICCQSIKEWEKSRVELSFRAKITKNKKVPQTQLEMNQLEDIIVINQCYNEQFVKYNQMAEKNGNKIISEYKPDEYGYLNSFFFKIYIKKYFVPDYVRFIGNFEIIPPANEYIPLTRFSGVPLSTWETLIPNLIKAYENYNLRKLNIYQPEGNKKFHESSKQDLDIFLEVLEELPKMNIVEDEKVKKNTLTYVGGEDVDPYTSKTRKTKIIRK